MPMPSAWTVNMRGGGGNLAPGPRRMAQAVRTINDQGGTLVLLTEFSNWQAARIVTHHRRWGLSIGTPNVRRGGTLIGNAVAYKRTTWAQIAEDEVEARGGWKRPALHFPAVRLLHKRTGAEVWAIAVHLPPGRSPGARLARRRALRPVRRWARAQTAPVVLGGDLNDPRLLHDWPGFNHRLDHVRALGITPERPRVHYGFGARRITDHPAALSVRLPLA